ncbi:helix-turn-helix domain-containing protein [Epibacterium sp. Ofav1-8]|uniref:helix-turn-helix domain-containing protein n=1 Tax=Epibacterium sp. Ofav1-8 TaxID=2917735 RepID=UPI001EF54D11|nr:helix-turn-helix transcriptional regulator [Epibacterium sp. Ofav1-8]MCG7622584.1 helix-turn-helix transcriptional regulator [Epibacterium sp. Ofav1-8]
MGTFGAALKDWRQIRRRSQLDLAMAAGVSARHLSFLETGRAQPSRAMVLRLAAELAVPQAGVNTLLQAAGLAPAYGARRLTDAEMAPLRDAVEWMLTRHAPYPAMALDRHWRICALNAPARSLLAPVGLGEGADMLSELMQNQRLRDSLINLAEIERLTLHRLRSELAHFGREPVLEDAIRRLEAHVVAAPDTGPAEGLPPVIPARYRLGGQELSFFSAISQFGTVEDIALSELKIECLFPADEPTRAALIALTDAQP